MEVVIQKFGGKLLETAEHIRRAAKFVIDTKTGGEHPVVVVSAPGSTTDKFLEMVREVSSDPDQRELDMLLSVGERTAMALLAIAIIDMSPYRAVSFTGSQVGIITDTKHTDAKVLEVRGYRIKEALEKDYIPIVAGFQGVSTEREITTLGRGGSDTTAVALGIALKANRCELVKDHGGVFTADPEIIPEALQHKEIDYQTLSEITSAGAKVINSRAVTLAGQHNLNISVVAPDKSTQTIVSGRTLDVFGVSSIVLEADLFLLKLCDSEQVPDLAGDRYFSIEGKSIVLSKRDIPGYNAERVELISLTGWGDSLKNDVSRSIREYLDTQQVHPKVTVFDSNKIMLVIAKGCGRDLVKKLHDYCHNCGFL